MKLIAVGYNASFALALRTVIHFWAFKKKWAVFVAMFKPLGNVIALVLGIIFLGETIYLGRVVGGIIVSVGFYAVIWGKA
ncbi:WAT1-related protein At5g40230 [Ziziphus jujuba]|uniref:WAT1-related protein At5g40230 n=1 Tax=Ziziphus jujuba TaxID=326968 RepID=A0ABM3ZYT4_ZIZJJ|nr:WAT1-related protein At5g40230-like [Ziziphus jujuba var. spinosa]XP_060669647.1 WAT1-related protein At5g40230 [Ziziphus jujuba]